ncbi:MAG TPA: YciI family protein [Gammaproteobacteria bacterium]|nr:YciI family protein [Gammaproteobacteria bacterium]
MSEPKVMAQDVRDACEGMLRKQLYTVFTRPADGLGPVMEVLEAHLKFQISLEERGVMFGAGPFFSDDEQQWRGEGMVIIRAKDLEEAKAIAAEDPMHSSGARVYEVRPWLLCEGSVTIKLSHSKRSYEVL